MVVKRSNHTKEEHTGVKEKKRVNDLALFGGEAAFVEQLHVGRPNIGDKQHLFTLINDMLERRWLTNNGPYLKDFEERLCHYLGVKHCICMCNGTVALEVAARALGMHGEVIVPSFTFIASAHALQWQEITPVFCDIDPKTHNINPLSVEKMITPRTSGILGVHLWGRACPIKELSEIATRHQIRLMFDAAHAFGCSHEGKMIGNFGHAEVLSFHATKFFNTFEGGAVVTNDDDLAQRIRLMTNFGFSGYDRVVYLGTNAKMQEISAIMGINGLHSIDQFIAINRRNYKHYQHYLENIAGVTMVQYNEMEKHNYQYIILEIEESQTQISRDTLVAILQAENIMARRYFYPGCHRMEPYRSYSPHAGLLLPETEKLTNKVLALPTGTAVNEEHISTICQLIRFAIKHGENIQKK